MKKMLFLTSLLGMAVSTSALAVKWDMPTPYGDGNHHTKVAKSFADEVRQKTNGKLDIVVHPGGSLIKHPEIFRAVKTRQVQIGEIFMGRLGNEDPIFKLDNLPFLATDFDSSKKLYDVTKDAVTQKLQKEKMVFLYAGPWPAQDLYSNKPVASLADLKGLKMRTYSASTARLADLMGTVPVQVPFGDIPQAFATSVIDAMVTSPSTGVNQRSWDYTSNFTTINAWIPKNMVMVNKRAFQKLDKKTQAIVLEAAANAEKNLWGEARRLAKEHTEKLSAEGMKVVTPSSKLDQELRAIGKVMLDEWLAEAGDAGQKIIDAYNK